MRRRGLPNDAESRGRSDFLHHLSVGRQFALVLWQRICTRARSRSRPRMRPPERRHAPPAQLDVAPQRRPTASEPRRLHRLPPPPAEEVQSAANHKDGQHDERQVAQSTVRRLARRQVQEGTVVVVTCRIIGRVRRRRWRGRRDRFCLGRGSLRRRNCRRVECWRRAGACTRREARCVRGSTALSRGAVARQRKCRVQGPRDDGRAHLTRRASHHGRKRRRHIRRVRRRRLPEQAGEIGLCPCQSLDSAVAWWRSTYGIHVVTKRRPACVECSLRLFVACSGSLSNCCQPETADPELSSPFRDAAPRSSSDYTRSVCALQHVAQSSSLVTVPVRRSL